jgi:hypothetical protein
VVVFHSNADDLLPIRDALPFEVIADPDKRLYKYFRVEYGARALLSPGVWIPILFGILRSLGKALLKKAPLPPINPHGGRLGLPADFLIGQNGAILECKYGSHAYDQWSVEEILALSRTVESGSARAAVPR